MHQLTVRHDLYAILDVPEIASDEQIKAAYRPIGASAPSRRQPGSARRSRSSHQAHHRSVWRSGRRRKTRALRQRPAPGRHRRGRTVVSPSRAGRTRKSAGPPYASIWVWTRTTSPHGSVWPMRFCSKWRGRDAVPATPVQKRTFTNLCRQAAQKLDDAGQHSDADDLRADLRRKDAQSHFYR